MASFVLSFFPLDVFDGIWDLSQFLRDFLLTLDLLLILAHARLPNYKNC